MGRKDGVKNGFMRRLHGGFQRLGGRYREQAPSHIWTGYILGIRSTCGRGLAPDSVGTVTAAPIWCDAGEFQTPNHPPHDSCAALRQ